MKESYENELIYLNNLIKEYGGVDCYTTTQAADIFEQICKIIKLAGLNPEKRDELVEGFSRIFNLELINKPNFEHGNYIYVPNHISEFDGFLYGILIPHMLVVAKTDWVSDPRLNAFLDNLFQRVGVVRKDYSSGIKVLKSCINHLNAAQENNVTVFVQQTIADIDLTVPEDIAPGVCFISKKTSAKIIPVYAEQVSIDNPTRIVFGYPIECFDKEEFGKIWLEREYELRDSISSPAARPPVLCEKHRKPISQREF